MIAADGEIEDQEIGQLVTAIGMFPNPQQLLDDAIEYWKKFPFDQFINEYNAHAVAKTFHPFEHLDSLLADGVADPSEQELFGTFLQAFV